MAEALERLSTYEVLRPMRAAMTKLVDMLRRDPAFAGVQPTLSHASLFLSFGGNSRRVYVGWTEGELEEGEFDVAFVDSLMEFSERTLVREDRVVAVLREYLVRLGKMELAP